MSIVRCKNLKNVALQHFHLKIQQLSFLLPQMKDGIVK